MRHRPAFAALLIATLAATPAAAQSQAALRAHIAATNRGCTVNGPQVVHRGPLPGAAEPVVVATYGLESCGGGNDWLSTFGVFAQQGGRFVSLPIRNPPRWVVDGVRVDGGVLVVRGLDYGPDDGRCCPSIRREARFRLSGGTVVPVPRAHQ
jgi:hypothetical protein